MRRCCGILMEKLKNKNLKSPVLVVALSRGFIYIPSRTYNLTVNVAGECKMIETKKMYYVVLSIAFWGAAWGIFEATVGYLLHLINFGYSWLIWGPAACFFMANVYRKTGRISSIVFVGVLCASIKMLNFLLPVSIDKVINPAISILLEALSLAGTVFAAKSLFKERRESLIIKALIALGMNTVWRLLYSLYLFVLVPVWIRDISVISSASNAITFLITQNLFTSVLLFIGYLYLPYLFMPVEIIERRFSSFKAPSFIRPAIALLMLSANIAFQIALK